MVTKVGKGGITILLSRISSPERPRNPLEPLRFGGLVAAESLAQDGAPNPAWISWDRRGSGGVLRGVSREDEIEVVESDIQNNAGGVLGGRGCLHVGG